MPPDLSGGYFLTDLNKAHSLFDYEPVHKKKKSIEIKLLRGISNRVGPVSVKPVPSSSLGQDLSAAEQAQHDKRTRFEACYVDGA
jgi:hypothetical protein